MKVLFVLVLAAVSVSGRGSGPYLPSGWRPQGPAFFLPSEIQIKPAGNFKASFQESEASGSDSLREYGPPKLEVTNEIVNQGLPDAVTELVFKGKEQAVEKVEGQVVSEQKSVSEVQQVVVTEATVEKTNTATEAVVENTASIEAIEEKADSVAEPIVVEEQTVKAEITPAIIEEIIEVATVSAVEEKSDVTTSEPVVIEEQAAVDVTTVVEEKIDEATTAQPIVEEKTEVIAFEPLVVSDQVDVKAVAVEEEQAEATTAQPTVEEIAEGTDSPVAQKTEVVATESVEEIVKKEESVAEAKSENVSEVEEKSDVVTEQVLVEKSQDLALENSVLDLQAEVEVTTPISVEAESSQFKSETTEKIAEVVEETPTVASVEATANVQSEVYSVTSEQVQQVVDEIKTEEKKVEELNTIVEEVKIAEEGVKTVQGEVNNIADALLALDNEAKAEQIQTEVNLSQEVLGALQQFPEGFLEYGPPGFREYGPPKGDELVGAALEASAESSNELRKRRFSPKFRPTKH